MLLVHGKRDPLTGKNHDHRKQWLPGTEQKSRPSFGREQPKTVGH